MNENEDNYNQTLKQSTKNAVHNKALCLTLTDEGFPIVIGHKNVETPSVSFVWAKFTYGLIKEGIKLEIIIFEGR